jgi:flagellar biosynthesis chaperone FliJ
MGMIEDLSKLGKEIETAKKSVDQLEGRRTEVLERLKTEFDVKSVDEAEVVLDQLDKDILKMDETINKEFAELKEKFTW